MRRLALALLLVPAGLARAQEDEAARSGVLSPGGLVVFQDSRGPLSFAAMTRKELPADLVPAGEVTREACQHGVNIPLGRNMGANSVSGAGGDGGYERALQNLRFRNPQVAAVYDVKVDVHIISILRIYRRRCTEITARALVPKEAARP